MFHFLLENSQLLHQVLKSTTGLNIDYSLPYILKQSYKFRSLNLNMWNILVGVDYSVKAKNIFEDFKTGWWVSALPPPDLITHSKLGRVMAYSDHHRSCQQAVPTLSLPQSSCCSASGLPSLRPFSSGPSSGLSIGPLVLSQ